MCHGRVVLLESLRPAHSRNAKLELETSASPRADKF